MTKPKILFLDIDGVLNNVASAIYYRKLGVKEKWERGTDVYSYLARNEFSQDAVANLWNIVDSTNCKIVISSTWRLGATREEMKNWFSGIPKIQDAIVGYTGHFRKDFIKADGSTGIMNCPRGMEIAAWLETEHYSAYHDRFRFAILDDDSDMWPVQENLFQTDSHEGLTYRISQKVITHLNYEEATIQKVTPEMLQQQ